MADRDDLQVSDCVKLLAILRTLRRAMNRTMNGEAVLWTDIHTLKVCIRKTVVGYDRPAEDELSALSELRHRYVPPDFRSFLS